MKRIKTLLLIAITVCSVQINAQPTGFWEITKVSVGDQEMTPVAKWTRINNDGTYQSGNGWLQNSVGTWDYDNKSRVFSPKETNGILESYGGFKVDQEGNNMTWQREEDGMQVTVSLKRIEELPMSPADHAVGLWDLTSASKNGADIQSQIDPDDNYNIHMRWSRLFVERSTAGKGSGYWFIHAHRPELTMMSHDSENKPIQSWMISFENDQMIWTGNSDSNRGQVLRYSRIFEFPN